MIDPKRLTDMVVDEVQGNGQMGRKLRRQIQGG